MVRGIFKKSKLLVAVLFFLVTAVAGYDCKIEGCPGDFRCMANGECNPLMVKEYCEGHGKPPYIYENSLLERNCSDILNLKEEKLCMQCKSDYGLRKNVEDIENIIFGVAAGLAILMMSRGGIKLVTSQGYRERENAKRRIIYVILALIVIVTTTKFVEYLLL
jgi:hypothetical protein